MLPVLALSLILITPPLAFAWDSAETAYPANPSMQSDSLFVGGEGGFLLDADTGATLWRYRLSAEAIGSALFSDNRIVVFTGERVNATSSAGLLRTVFGNQLTKRRV